MALPPGVPLGARKLHITSLLTPACFWGHEDFGNLKSRDMEKLQLLEKELTLAYPNSKYGDEQHYIPVENELVAVLDPKKKLWVRGRVLKWSKLNRGEIFLVDYGSHLSDVQLVRPLPPHAHELKYQAVQMFLYGVIPLTDQYDHRHSTFNTSSNHGWVATALRQIQDVLSESMSFHFTCCRSWGEALLGDLYIHRKEDSRAISLTKILIDQKLAIYDYERFNKELDMRVGPLMLTSSRGGDLRTVCMVTSTSFAAIAQQYRHSAPPLEKSEQLPVKHRQTSDTEFIPAGIDFSTMKRPTRLPSLPTAEPKDAQYRTSPRDNAHQGATSRFTNDRQMQGLPRGGRQVQSPPRGGRHMQGPSRDSYVEQEMRGLSRDRGFSDQDAPGAFRSSNAMGRARKASGMSEHEEGPYRGGASNFQNRDRSGPPGRNYYPGNDGARRAPMDNAGYFEEVDRTKPYKDICIENRGGGRGPPKGRGERFEERNSFVGQRGGERAPTTGRAEHFEGRDRPGPHGGKYWEQNVPGVNRNEERNRPGQQGSIQNKEVQSPPRRGSQFDRDVDMARPPGQHGSAKGQHSPNNQPGPYGDVNARHGPRNPPQPHEVPSRNGGEDISGISKLQPGPSSMLTQLTGTSSQETVYKKPQPRVQGAPQPAQPTQSNAPAAPYSGPGAVNIEQDATRPVAPAPVNKFANKEFGVKKRTGSNSNSSSNSSKDEALFLPPLLSLNQPQLPVLVQGCDISKPLDSLSKAPLHFDIHRALEQMRVTSLTIQQKHMLPAIFRGQNVVSVGPADSGKTLGFIIPLASSMLDASKYIELKDVFGPLVLVLCSNSDRATLVYKWFTQLTRCDLKDYAYSYSKGYRDTKPRVKVLLTYGGGAEKEKLMEMFNGCHVLISTPPCLLRLLAFWEEVLTNFNRLCHLVFDDADILFEKFNLDVCKILGLAQKGISSKERKGRNLETIVTAKQWTEALEQFASKVLTNPTIIISTGLEVMAYSKVVPSMHTVEVLETRIDILADLVKAQERPYKMLVACTFQHEVLDIHRKMQSLKPKDDSMLVLMAHDSINHLGLISIKDKWESSRNVLLLVCDSVLSEMDIFDASVLIHFSMTDQRSSFNTRMSTIIKNCPDRFSSIKEQREKAKPQVHMLIIEQDTVQIPLLLELTRRLKAPVPAMLEQREKQETTNKEERKKQLPLCDQLCCFGTCTSPFSCPYRHGLIAELDKSPQYIPESGEVKLKPMTVHNATHFSARIEGHRAPDGKFSPTQSKEHVYLPIEISEHFSIPSNSGGKHEEKEQDEPQKSPDAVVNEFEEMHIEEDEQMDLALNQEEETEIKVEGLEEKEEGELEDECDAKHRDPRSPINCVINKKPKLEGEAEIFHVRSDLFEAPLDHSLAHCVAEDLVMNRGVARGFLDRFGQQSVLRAQRKRCGQVAYIQAEGRYVFYLITKQRTNSKPICLEVLQACLLELRRLCVELKVEKLAIPQLGRGLNHMNWESVRKCLEDAFSQSAIKIGVYHILLLEMTGDLMRAPPPFSLAHCVAEDLVMSRGVANQFRSRFGRQAQLVAQKKKVGEVAYLQDGRRYIFYLITKRFSTPDCKPTLDTLRSSLLDLKAKCLELKVFNLAIPRIGTGIDQLSWCDVRQCLDDIFNDTDIEIRVYQLSCELPPGQSRQYAQRDSLSARPQGSPSNQEPPRQVLRDLDQQPPFSPMQHSPIRFGGQSPSFNSRHSNFEGQHSPHSRNPNFPSQNKRGYGRGRSSLLNQKDDIGESPGFYKERELDF